MKAPKSKKSGPKVEMAAMSTDLDSKERDWRAEDALRTLTEAERVRRDKALMADVEKARKSKMADLERVTCEVAPKTMGKK